MKTTIREISKITGFSPATVSNALNKKRGVSSETSEKIFQAAKELGYLDRVSVEKMRFVIYKANGLITDDTSFLSMLLDGFQKECQKTGYEMTIHYLDRREASFRYKLAELLADEASALVIVGDEIQEDDSALFEKTRCPLLMLDYWNERMNFNSIQINNEEAVSETVDYLVKKGHRRIGYLRSDFRTYEFWEREAGYQKGLNKNGLPYQAEYVVTMPVSMDGAYQEMKRFLSGDPRLPTAFLADKDAIALGAMKAILEAGLSVPGNISLVGFDDIPFSEISSPRLSSLRVPRQEMGAIAVRRMHEMLQTESPVRTRVLIWPEFIERESVKNISDITA